MATEPTPMTCDRCGAANFVDTSIHGGASTRRDCARCGLTMGFPVWYGQATTLEQRQTYNQRTLVLQPRRGLRPCA